MLGDGALAGPRTDEERVQQIISHIRSTREDHWECRYSPSCFHLTKARDLWIVVPCAACQNCHSDKSRLELTPGTVLLDPLHMTEHVTLVCAILQIFSALEPGIESLIDSRS
jgi:hypothetical protein